MSEVGQPAGAHQRLDGSDRDRRIEFVPRALDDANRGVRHHEPNFVLGLSGELVAVDQYERTTTAPLDEMREDDRLAAARRQHDEQPLAAGLSLLDRR